MQHTISFVLDGRIVTPDFTGSGPISPTTTVLNYLRSLPDHQGTKRGCDEGDCGACTVVLGTPGPGNSIVYKAVNSCLLFLPMIHGKHLVTVENLRDESGRLHPVQQSMVEQHGSQCGFCTPGFVMSLLALYKDAGAPLTRETIESALTGNLCRCTGYEQILDAANDALAAPVADRLTADEPRISELLRSIPAESVHLDTGRQRYMLPATIAEVLQFLTEHPNALLIGGATDVALRVTKRYELLPEIIDLSHVAEMQSVRESTEAAEIGSGVTMQELLPLAENSFPALHAMLSVFGSQQIRNLATIGGNLGTSSPISDTLPVLMAYGARIVLQSSKGTRELPLEQYIVGYRKTAREQHEIIRSVIIPKCSNGVTVRSYKVSKRRDFDISTVSAGFRLHRDKKNVVREVRLAYGGMAECTRRAAGAERFLTGKTWSRETVEEAMKLIATDFQPISDVRAGADMRRVAAKNLLLKFWAETHDNGH